MMQLALKHAPPKGFWKRAFHALTKARLATSYPHAAIIIDGRILHSSFDRGLHAEPFLPEGWDLFDVPHADEKRTQRLFQALEGTPYDAFSLLAFVLPWRVSDSSRLYCYEWCLLALTGDAPKRRVTPENLLALVARGLPDA